MDMPSPIQAWTKNEDSMEHEWLTCWRFSYKKIHYGTVEDDIDTQRAVAEKREDTFEKYLNNDPDAEPIPWYCCTLF